jgi:hypothetical protein
VDGKIFEHSDIKLGKEVSLIALCSNVDRKQNLGTAGSYREEYHINGKNGAVIKAVRFKNNFTLTVNPEEWKEVPVFIQGTIGEYRDVLNIVITSITNLKDTLDLDDLKHELMDPAILSELNDFLYGQGTTKILSQDFLMPATGIEGGGCGVLVERLYKVLRTSEVLFPEILKEYVKHLHAVVHIYRYTENKLDERITEDTLKHRFLRAITMNPQEYPEYLDFVKMHHLIMKPRGCDIEIFDRSFNTTSRNRSDTE